METSCQEICVSDFIDLCKFWIFLFNLELFILLPVKVRNQFLRAKCDIFWRSHGEVQMFKCDIYQSNILIELCFLPFLLFSRQDWGQSRDLSRGREYQSVAHWFDSRHRSFIGKRGQPSQTAELCSLSELETHPNSQRFVGWQFEDGRHLRPHARSHGRNEKYAEVPGCVLWLISYF